MKIQLLFPPHWRPTQPYLSLPVLSSHLKAHDFDVLLRDINVECFDILLSPEYLEPCLTQVQKDLNQFCDAPSLSEARVRWLKRLFRIETDAEYVLCNIGQAKQILRSEDAFISEKCRWASQVIAGGLDLATAQYADVVLSFDLYRDKWDPTVSSDVYEAVTTPDSFFSCFFNQHILSTIIQEQSDLIGISINSPSQVIPGLILARLIREQSNCHITIGGTHFSYIFDNSDSFKQLFKFIDSLVLFEGEETLLSLANRLRDGNDFDDIENLITARNANQQAKASRSRYDITTCTPPDFESLPLHLYFTPSVVFPLQGSRGCYWQRCKFCDYTYESPSYRFKTPEQLYHEINCLPSGTEPRFLHLVDSAPTVHSLLMLSNTLQKQQEEVYWATMFRFEKQLEDPEVLQQMYNGGCRILEFGLESGSQDTLDLIDKGATLKTVKRVLENCRMCGIFTVAFLIIGMPGESASDIRKTIDFIQNELGDLIDAISPNRFALKKHSVFGIELQTSSNLDLHQPLKDWCDELVLPEEHTINEEDMRHYMKIINKIKRGKPVEQTLYGTLWDVSFLLQYSSLPAKPTH